MVLFDLLRNEQVCTCCGAVSNLEPKYPAIQTQHYSPTFISSREKLGSAPPKALPAYQHLKFRHELHHTIPKEVRRVRRAMPPFQLVCGNLRLPRDVRERAEFLYKASITKGMLKGRDSYAMSLAAIEKACIDAGIRRQKHEEASLLLLGIDWRKVMDYLIMLDTGKKWGSNKAGFVFPVLFAALDDFELPESITAKTIEIFDRMRDEGAFPGKPPETIAAGIIVEACMKCDCPVDKAALAGSLGISERSVRRLLAAKRGVGQQSQALAPNIVWTRRDRTNIRGWVASLFDRVVKERLFQELEEKAAEIPVSTACNVDTVPGQEGAQIAFCSSRPEARRIPEPDTRHYDISELFELELCLHCLVKERITIRRIRGCLSCGRVYTIPEPAGVHEVFE